MFNLISEGPKEIKKKERSSRHREQQNAQMLSMVKGYSLELWEQSEGGKMRLVRSQTLQSALTHGKLCVLPLDFSR